MPAIMHLMPPPPTLSMVSTLQSAMSAALCTNLFCSESRLAQALIHNIITIIRNICSKEAKSSCLLKIATGWTKKKGDLKKHGHNYTEIYQKGKKLVCFGKFSLNAAG